MILGKIIAKANYSMIRKSESFVALGWEQRKKSITNGIRKFGE